MWVSGVRRTERFRLHLHDTEKFYVSCRGASSPFLSMIPSRLPPFPNPETPRWNGSVPTRSYADVHVAELKTPAGMEVRPRSYAMHTIGINLARLC